MINYFRMPLVVMLLSLVVLLPTRLYAVRHCQSSDYFDKKLWCEGYSPQCDRTCHCQFENFEQIGPNYTLRFNQDTFNGSGFTNYTYQVNIFRSQCSLKELVNEGLQLSTEVHPGRSSCMTSISQSTDQLVLTLYNCTGRQININGSSVAVYVQMDRLNMSKNTSYGMHQPLDVHIVIVDPRKLLFSVQDHAYVCVCVYIYTCNLLSYSE